MSGVCVVHLVRAQNGTEPFKRFMQSYAGYRSGLSHDLLIIFKGFNEKKDLFEYDKLLEAYDHKSFFVPDTGYDITPYFLTANTFDYEYFCFLNSFSCILDEDWLRKMYNVVSDKHVGAVGATGSYGSPYSHLLCQLGKPSAYSDLLKDHFGKESFSRFFSACLAGQQHVISTKPFYKRFLINLYNRSVLASRYKIATYTKLRQYKSHFDIFPADHLRTNAFMISRNVAQKIRHERIREKFDAFKFESGKNSMTRQILRMDLKVLVVGKNGKGYEKEKWFDSDTFWQGKQSNLLVADNQTNDYLYGDAERRLFLSRFAWGDKANPALR